jgi:hypothetical protein
MDVHRLINLTGYGNAQKELRKAGLWRVTDNDEERIAWIAENVTSMKRLKDSQTWKFETNADDYDVEFFRQDVDDAATAQEAAE